MTKKQLELENARLQGENEALKAQNAALIDALRHGNDNPMQWVTTGYADAQSDCLHESCPTCHGTGVGPIGPCAHMMSCPCRICSPQYLTQVIAPCN